MKIIPLGTRGFYPSFGRHTMSFLLYDERSMFILDAGTGLARLKEEKLAALVAKYEMVHILLSHYHLDHITGLPYLAGVLPHTKFNLYVPSPPFSDVDGPGVIHTFLNPPFFSLSMTDFPGFSQLIEITQARLEIEGHLLEFMRLKHGGGSVGIKIDRTISYITDTVPDPRVVEFIRGSQLVLHEVWMTGDEAAAKPGTPKIHCSYPEVLDMMHQAAVKKLVPVHLNPAWDEAAIRNIFHERVMTGLEVILPMEAEIIDF
ncbi:MBL fold metallo-hydrolase [Gaoshiqia sediminis]|uniref:MBL fold metallo-hydrolase n=1 Tax=Gaoshiqia sediminis TaxID=2986998 RepID=A0AA42C5L4_9BACT|nr:MBL fold metallo-hydrolase [Gaoshiqia sediminis]MCW0482973.1 MBL fold metallo-hydrolase [Gaoshiqia sediminis]